MCDMKTHSNNCSGPLVGNALGKVILISTPRDANTRYNREPRWRVLAGIFINGNALGKVILISTPRDANTRVPYLSSVLDTARRS
jgi:hypothetical protein